MKRGFIHSVIQQMMGKEASTKRKTDFILESYISTVQEVTRDSRVLERIARGYSKHFIFVFFSIRQSSFTPGFIFIFE